MVTLPFRPARTLLVKKPVSWRRRCSKAKKKKVRSRSNGPPSVAPYCARVNGGFLPGVLSMTGAKALGAWKLLCRRKPKMLPRTWFVPDLVTTLTTPPEVLPNSGA